MNQRLRTSFRSLSTGLTAATLVCLVIAAGFTLGLSQRGAPASTASQPDLVAPTSLPEVVVRQQDFGSWRYVAARYNNGLRVGVSYNHRSVPDLDSYVAANTQLLNQLLQNGGQQRARVMITFRSPLAPDVFRVWARQKGLDVHGSQSTFGTTTVFTAGKPDDPLPAESFAGGRVFGVDCTVSVARLAEILADPQVYLLDVTPTWIPLDLAAAGVADAAQARVFVDFPFAYMQRLGLENFASDLAATAVPMPAGSMEPAPVPTP